MLNRISTYPRERVYLIVLASVGLLRFVYLGFLDLQAWDEALYAVRAEGILRFGGVLDQTSFSIGGLYSSLHPPLSIWLTSLSFAMFGVTEFAARVSSAVLGGLTLFVIYRIGKELQNPKLGFVAALLFGLNPFVTFFARQGQFDSTLVFFLSLAFLYYLKSSREPSVRNALLAGVCVGASLMTKLFVGLGIPAAFLLWKVSASERDRSSSWKFFFISIAALVVIAAPWHVYMTIVRGFGNPLFFLDASAVFERSVSGIEGNVKPLETLYFVNQLFVLFPLGVLWFALGLIQQFKERSRSWMLVVFWFLVFFVVFSLMRTKLSVYMLPMLVPASLISAKVLLEFVERKHTTTLLFSLLGGSGICFLWAASQSWRNATKAVIASLVTARMPSLIESVPFLSFVASILVLLYVLLVVYKYSREEFIRRLMLPALLLPSFLMSFYSIAVTDRTTYRDGGKKVADFISNHLPPAILVAGFDRNPQLTYYLGGMDIGWRNDVEMRRLTPPAIRGEFRAWLTAETRSLPAGGLLIVEKDKFIRYNWITAEEVRPPDFTLMLDSRRYSVFQRTPSSHFALSTMKALSGSSQDYGKE